MNITDIIAAVQNLGSGSIPSALAGAGLGTGVMWLWNRSLINDKNDAIDRAKDAEASKDEMMRKSIEALTLCNAYLGKSNTNNDALVSKITALETAIKGFGCRFESPK